MSDKKIKNILVLAGVFDSHIPGLFEIVKDLKNLGHNVTCYVLESLENRLKPTGAKLIPICVGKIELPPEAPEVAKNSVIVAKFYDGIISKAINSEEKFYYLLYDSFFDGTEINKIFKIPNIVAVYIFPVGEMTPFVKNKFCGRMLSLNPINKKYNLNLRDYVMIHYIGDAKYKLMLTSKLFHVDSKIIDDSFYFIGPSIEERPLDTSFNFKKDENKKLIYISLGTIFNDSIEFYKTCIETFENLKEFQVIMSIGKYVNIKDLGEVSENIYIYNHIPQLQVLKMTDIFITHGGINSINEGILLNKLPLIVIPQEMDQFDNGKQIEKFGAGIALDGNTLNKEILKNSVFEILKNENKYKIGIETIAKSFKEAREERRKIYEKIFT